MNKSITLTRQQKTSVKNYLNNFAQKLQTNDYSLSEDFAGCTTAEDMKKYHIGMQFAVEQMLHELKSTKKQDLNLSKSINSDLNF